MFRLADLTQNRAVTPPPLSVPLAQSRNGSMSPLQVARNLSVHSMPTMSPHEQHSVPRRTFSAPAFASALFKSSDEDVESSAQLLRQLRGSKQKEEEEEEQEEEEQQQQQQQQQHEHQQHQHEHQHQQYQPQLLRGDGMIVLLAQQELALQQLLQQSDLMASVLSQQLLQRDLDNLLQGEQHQQQDSDPLIARGLLHPKDDRSAAPAVLPTTFLHFNSTLDVLKHLFIHF
jgi:hypothetical protein